LERYDREGLDLPEVSLVAILDADKEGFLRSETSLIQTIGRAARNVSGKVIMYADNITGSMQRAIEETNRRRNIQIDHNIKHGITPRTIQKEVRSIVKDEIRAPTLGDFDTAEPDDIEELIALLEDEMHIAASELKFEEAAVIRDRLTELKKELLKLSKKKKKRK